MKLAYFPNQIARNARPVLDAFVTGCRKHDVVLCEADLGADAAVIWSQLWAGRMKPNQAVYEHYRDSGRPVIVIDVGAIQRNLTWRITMAGQNWLAGTGHDRARRDRMGLQLEPWRFHGEHIVIAMQRPDSNQWRHMPDPAAWLSNVVDLIRTHSTRPIKVRPHPRFPIACRIPGVTMDVPQPVPDTYDHFDFDRSLHNAWAVVNCNSTPGVLSVIKGIPAFVCPTSLAAPVANLDLSQIENASRPDREGWINDLAWTEWTVPEIEQGIPQQYMIAAISDRDSL